MMRGGSADRAVASRVRRQLLSLSSLARLACDQADEGSRVINHQDGDGVVILFTDDYEGMT